jgi:hypothetical protein
LTEDKKYSEPFEKKVEILKKELPRYQRFLDLLERLSGERRAHLHMPSMSADKKFFHAAFQEALQPELFSARTEWYELNIASAKDLLVSLLTKTETAFCLIV